MEHSGPGTSNYPKGIYERSCQTTVDWTQRGGVGILSLLFIRGTFIRVVGFVLIILGLFTLISLSIPQMASLPPIEEKFDIATVKTPTDMATIGQKIFFSKGQCALCHT